MATPNPAASAAATGWRGEVWAGLKQRLPDGEPYLWDAGWRWVLGACTSWGSARIYLGHWARWCQASALSLSGQLAQRSSDLDAWLIDLDQQLGQRARATALAAVSSWYGQLADWGLLAANPVARRHRRLVRVDQERVTRGDGTRSSFTDAEAIAALRWAEGQSDAIYCAIALLLTTGCRGHELAQSDARQIRRDGDDTWTWVIHGKGNKTRKITLEPAGARAVMRYLRGRQHGQLFCSASGKPTSLRTIQGWAKAAATAAGRPELSTHDFRKTHATLLLDRGAKIEAVQRRLGHCSPLLTLRAYVTRHRELTTTTGLEA